MGVDQPEIRRLMEVSIMFDIGTYCVFTLYGRPSYRHTEEETAQLQTESMQQRNPIGSLHFGHLRLLLILSLSSVECRRSLFP